MRKSITILAFLVSSVFALSAQTVVRIGALGAIPAIFDPIRAGLEKSTGIKLLFTEMGAADAWMAVEAGKVDVAVSATSMEGWMDLMESRGVHLKPRYDYRNCVLGLDEMCVLINPDVLADASMLVADLDKATIKKLFTGAVKNWKEVGGPDLPVVVMGWKKLQVTSMEFRDKALDGAPYRPDAITLTCESIREYLDILGKTPGAISLGSLVVTKSKKVWSPDQSPRLVRPFTLLVPDKQTDEMRKAVAAMVDYIHHPKP
jgi:phosphate transport system substrate-binding protein